MYIYVIQHFHMIYFNVHRYATEHFVNIYLFGQIYVV